jgi:hypothetical protein
MTIWFTAKMLGHTEEIPDYYTRLQKMEAGLARSHKRNNYSLTKWVYTPHNLGSHWRGMALWRAGRNNQKNWFIALLLINSIGILPIIYLITNPRNVKFKAVS